VAQVALGPALAATGLLDDADAMLQRLGARRAVSEMAHAGDLGRSQLQCVVLVVVPAPQIDGLAAPAALGHPEHVDEEAQRLFGLGREQLDMREMR
jgi:hypothetical protein